MHILEAQDLPDLSIRQRRFKFTHIPGDWRVGRIPFQYLCGSLLCRDRIIRSIEYLEAQPIFLHTQITNLTQIPRISIAPCIPFPRLGFVYVAWKIQVILMRFNDTPNPQSIDIRSREPTGKAAGTCFTTKLARRIRILWIIVVILFQGEIMEISIALRETDAVCCFGAGNDDFLDADFAGGFNDIVCAQDVAPEAFAVWDKEIASICCKMNHGIGFFDTDTSRATRVLVVGKMEMGGEGVEDLAGVCEVGFQGVDCGMRQGSKVDIQDRVAFRKKIGDTMSLTVVNMNLDVEYFP